MTAVNVPLARSATGRGCEANFQALSGAELFEVLGFWRDWSSTGSSPSGVQVSGIKSHARCTFFLMLPPSLLWCSKTSCRSNGWKSHRQNRPETAVVISSGEKGDRLVESLEVKASAATKLVRSAQGASNLTGRSKDEPGSREMSALREADLQESRES